VVAAPSQRQPPAIDERSSTRAPPRGRRRLVHEALPVEVAVQWDAGRVAEALAEARGTRARPRAAPRRAWVASTVRRSRPARRAAMPYSSTRRTPSCEDTGWNRARAPARPAPVGGPRREPSTSCSASSSSRRSARASLRREPAAPPPPLVSRTRRGAPRPELGLWLAVALSHDWPGGRHGQRRVVPSVDFLGALDVLAVSAGPRSTVATRDRSTAGRPRSRFRDGRMPVSPSPTPLLRSRADLRGTAKPRKPPRAQVARARVVALGIPLGIVGASTRTRARGRRVLVPRAKKTVAAAASTTVRSRPRLRRPCRLPCPRRLPRAPKRDVPTARTRQPGVVVVAHDAVPSTSSKSVVGTAAFRRRGTTSRALRRGQQARARRSGDTRRPEALNGGRLGPDVTDPSSVLGEGGGATRRCGSRSKGCLSARGRPTRWAPPRRTSSAYGRFDATPRSPVAFPAGADPCSSERRRRPCRASACPPTRRPTRRGRAESRCSSPAAVGARGRTRKVASSSCSARPGRASSLGAAAKATFAETWKDVPGAAGKGVVPGAGAASRSAGAREARRLQRADAR